MDRDIHAKSSEEAYLARPVVVALTRCVHVAAAAVDLEIFVEIVVLRSPGLPNGIDLVDDAMVTSVGKQRPDVAVRTEDLYALADLKGSVRFNRRLSSSLRVIKPG